jgi:hypothetical protein
VTAGNFILQISNLKSKIQNLKSQICPPMPHRPCDLTRRRFLAHAAAGLAAGFAAPAIVRAGQDQWGDLTGRFVYDGDPPERKKLKVDKDPQYTSKLDIRDESLMVGPDHGLANVYVYLRSSKAPVCPELEADVPRQVVLDNRDWVFRPHCLKIWCPRQEYLIVNSDPVAQNVAFTPLGDVPANIVLPVGAKATYRFSRSQSKPVPIACNYHPWERAYILPRANPYVAISAMDGTFLLPKLPVGQWQFQTWHERTEPFNSRQWPKGCFSLTIRPGRNDLGTIKIPPALLAQ